MRKHRSRCIQQRSLRSYRHEAAAVVFRLRGRCRCFCFFVFIVVAEG